MEAFTIYFEYKGIIHERQVWPLKVHLGFRFDITGGEKRIALTYYPATGEWEGEFTYPVTFYFHIANRHKPVLESIKEKILSYLRVNRLINEV